MFHLISLFTILFMFTEKNPLAPYGLTWRYPAVMSHFIINNAKCYYPYNNRNIFLSIKCCASYYKAFIETSTLPPMFHYLLSLPSLLSPALFGTLHIPPTTGTRHIGPGAWSSWGRGICRFQRGPVGSSSHQSGGPRTLIGYCRSGPHPWPVIITLCCFLLSCLARAAKPVTYFYTALRFWLSPLSHALPHGGLATCFLKTRHHTEPATFCSVLITAFRVLVILKSIIPSFPHLSSPLISHHLLSTSPFPQYKAKQSIANLGEGDLF